jgi:hypothetical protein
MAICLPLLNSGCLMLGDLAAYTEHSVNDMEKLSGGLSDAVRIGDVYESKIDLFLLTQKSGASRRFALSAPMNIPGVIGFYSSPLSRAAYYADRERWPEVINVIPQGTRVEVSDVKKSGSPGWGYTYTVFGKLQLVGWPLSTLASMEDLFMNANSGQNGQFASIANPRILERVPVSADSSMTP